MQDGWVDGIHIIDDVEHPRSFCVALPVGDILSVRAPSETVAAGEFFFIHPVECTVHDRLAPVMGQLSDLAGSDIFYIYILLFETKATRVPSGENFANIIDDSGSPFPNWRKVPSFRVSTQ